MCREIHVSEIHTAFLDECEEAVFAARDRGESGGLDLIRYDDSFEPFDRQDDSARVSYRPAERKDSSEHRKMPQQISSRPAKRR